MPSANGVYSLPPGYLAVTGATIQASQHNPPLEDIAAALTSRLSRDGTAAMTGPLKLADGVDAAPAVAFASAPSTGIRKSTNGIGFDVAGSFVAEIGANGFIVADKAIALRNLYHPSGPSLLLGTDSNAALTITAAVNNGSGLIRLSVASTTTFATSQVKTVSDVLGTTEANGTWTITVIDATHIDLQGSAFVNAYVSGGTIGGGVEEISIGAGMALTGSVLSSTINPALLPGFLSGLTLSTAGGSGTMSIAAGAANDSANGGIMTLASAIAKTTASWVVGTGNGGLDTGAIANSTWYHFFEIKRTDTGVVDVLFSLSATTPTMPSPYTLSRRIGSGKTDGSAHWIAFTQTGDTFIWVAPVLDSNAVTMTASRVNTTLTVPTGVTLAALFRASIVSASGNIQTLFTSLQENDQAPLNSLADLSAAFSGTTTSAQGSGSFERLVNTSAQIGVRSGGTNGSVSITTYGWKDSRGK